ncbi:hypothetical protein JANAI62_33720 [Jannaschia pagri]|uniref:Lipoprotein n=1 Tax=Jannaschia pagri TaxID=2829797 RepID=A0ABQ4NR73_9RHOB|nr:MULTISPECIES: DUF5333 family protein [unclassified Jannaschia]GIT92914.1 hypothetical protein JANAI61_33720 [Jannaschia sp. AI_61]GIT96749.1 hypothetical protein JANAI62_33720 [Jannaschia sp. AI_62]
MIRIASVCILLTLVGCNASNFSDAATREPGAPRTARPSADLLERSYVILRDVAFAKAIANDCPRYRLNTAQERQTEERIRVMGRAEEVPAQNLRSGLHNFRLSERARIQRDMINWIETRDVVLTDPATLCAAGDVERAEGTLVGAHLIPRG